MVATIYLDHNVLVGVAGNPRWTDSETEILSIERIRSHGVKFVLSAWHMYELARSEDTEHRRLYCEFVEMLQPLWAKNPIAVKRAELERFISYAPGSGVPEMPPIHAFTATVDEMWSSYGEVGITGQTFAGVVDALRADPSFLQAVADAAELTPDAILTGRRAHEDGRLKASEPIIDREYFAHLLQSSQDDQQVDRLLKNTKAVYRFCPTIAVEDTLTHVRIKDGFTPRAAHAADLQHALSGIPYCDGFVTDDKSLFENSRVTLKTLKLPTQLLRRINEISL
jgi:hypothetical protein